MKIYTRTGDDGGTALFGGARVGKNNARIEAVGAVDELNAALGVALAELAGDSSMATDLAGLLCGVQHRLFDLGAELATPSAEEKGVALIANRHVEALESAIDRWDAQLPPLRTFILPGGDRGAAQLHLARCVCRRAERVAVALAHVEPIREIAVVYLNRLGDLLFVAARLVNKLAGAGDVEWQKE